MPQKRTLKRARTAKREGKSPSTQAGEFVREEMHHIREGKHGARSTKQAIAIGLSKARRAGVKLRTPKNKLRTPKKGSASAATRRRAARDYREGRSSARGRKPSPRRARATMRALKREGRRAASRKSLSQQARRSSRRRSARSRSAAAKKAARTRARARTP